MKKFLGFILYVVATVVAYLIHPYFGGFLAVGGLITIALELMDIRV